MNVHGGGGTNIPKAFITLEEELIKVPKENQVTVIFISDGEDNEISTLEARMKKLKGNMGRTINFICLGIQGGFPTFLAMQLRQLYHNGFDSIPALYLVEYSSEKAFFNKFESMKDFFQSCSSLDILPPCKLYPWAEEKVEQYEGNWILTDGDYVVINDKQFEINEQNINIQDLVDIFRGWLQNLHLMALEDPKNSMKCAQLTLKEIDSQLETYKKNHGLDLKINIKDDTQNLSLYDKAFQNFMKNYGQRIVWFYKEIESIAKGEIQQNADQYEIAKKIQLGTITGKHMQKVLALKNITSDEFVKYVTEFEEIYKNVYKNKLEDLKKQQGKIPNEYIQFVDQRQVFEEPNLFACLKFFKSSYDAFDSFPIIGIPLLVKRPEGSADDPWKIFVKAIIKNQNFVDSTYLIEKQMKIQIEKQQGQNNEEVKVNENDDISEISGLIPLFSAKDKDLQPLICSRFFKFIISYLVSVNADAYYSQAYLALLGSTLLHVITNETKGDFKSKILEDIISTIDLVYSTDSEFLEYQKKLINDPASVLSQDKVTGQLEKALVYLFYFYYTKTITNEQIQKIFYNIVIEWFSKLFHSNNKEYANFIQLAFQKGNIVDNFKVLMPTYQSISQLKKTFKPDVIKFLAEQKIENIQFNEAVFKNISFSNIKLETLQSISSMILGKTFDSNDFIRLTYHVSANKDNEKKFSEPVMQDIEQIRKFSVSQYKQNYFTRNSMVKDAFTELKQVYLKQFSENHWDVTPFTKELLEKKCQSLGIDFNQLQINAESKLISNACCSEKCPFFLKVMQKEKIKQHLDSWVELLPKGFHKTISQNSNLNSQEIYQILVKQGFKPNNYNVTEEFTQNYIQKVLQSYILIKNT